MKKVFCRSDQSQHIKEISRDGSFPLLHHEKKGNRFMQQLHRLKCQKVRETEFHNNESSASDKQLFPTFEAYPHYEWSLEETNLRLSDVAPALPPMKNSSTESSEYIMLARSNSSGLPGTFDVDSDEERIGIRPNRSIDKKDTIISVESNTEPFVDSFSTEEQVRFPVNFDPFDDISGTFSCEKETAEAEPLTGEPLLRPTSEIETATTNDDSTTLVLMEDVSSSRSISVEPAFDSLAPPSIILSDSEEASFDGEGFPEEKAEESAHASDFEKREEPEHLPNVHVKDYLSPSILKNIDSDMGEPVGTRWSTRSSTSTKMQSLISMFESSSVKNPEKEPKQPKKRVIWQEQRDDGFESQQNSTVSSNASMDSKSSAPSFFWRSHPDSRKSFHRIVETKRMVNEKPASVLRPSRYIKQAEIISCGEV